MLIAGAQKSSNKTKGIVSIYFTPQEKISMLMTVAFDDRPVLNLIEVQSFGVQSNTVRMR